MQIYPKNTQSSKTLNDLFLELPENKSRRIKRLTPVNFEEYFNILKNITCINTDNINHFIQKYKIYENAILNKEYSYNLSQIGIYSKNNTNIQYYLDRGWSIEEANNKLKLRQGIISKLSSTKKDEYNKKRSATFSKNYKNNKHKKFYRPSEIEYWLNKGYSKKDAQIKMTNYYSKIGKEAHHKMRINGKEFLTIRQIKYWIKKGYSYEDAISNVKRVQTTTTLQKFVELYGEKKGLEKFNDRNKKWLDTLNNKSDEEKLDILIRKLKYTKRYSKSSILFFDNIFKILEYDYNIKFNKIFYKENEYFIYNDKEKELYFYDLTIPEINLIVEYNGIKFHPNKDKLSKNEWENWTNLYGNIDAETQYRKDNNKKNIAIEKGYEYLIIWEDETFENKTHKIINKILTLYENNRY
jgi:hypothetical protein